jgi:hypothetical protein
MRIFLLLFLSMFLSCTSNNHAENHVFEVKNIGRDTIFAIENHAAYRSNIYLKITGNINDTAFVYGIKIPPGRVNISGNYDYYDEDSIVITYRSYRATKGDLKIQYK